MFVLIFMLVGFTAMLFIFLHFGKKEKKRSEDFSQLARSLGMSFSSKVDSSFRKQLKEFKRFHGPPKNLNRYRNDIFRNKLSEKRNNLEIIFFECAPTHNDNGMGAMDGVFYFSSPALNLPGFELYPMLQLQQLFLGSIGVNQINFDSNPIFSQQYLLAGGDEKAVRSLFDKSLLDFFEDLDDKFYIQGRGNNMIIYRSCDHDPFTDSRPDVRVDLSNFKQLKQQVTQIVKHFL